MFIRLITSWFYVNPGKQWNNIEHIGKPLTKQRTTLTNHGKPQHNHLTRAKLLNESSTIKRSYNYQTRTQLHVVDKSTTSKQEYNYKAVLS